MSFKNYVFTKNISSNHKVFYLIIFNVVTIFYSNILLSGSFAALSSLLQDMNFKNYNGSFLKDTNNSANKIFNI